MPSTTTLFVGLSGLLANSRMLDTVGNNIANTNATAFKSSRILMSSNFSRTFSQGTKPGATTGGANPFQVGTGVSISGSQRDFTNGSLNPTGVNTDLAIEGDGFFVLQDAQAQRFTRNGTFSLNASNELVATNGARVQGFGVDGDFVIIDGSLVDVTIPIGTLTIAEATENVSFKGNLNASGIVGSLGAQIVFDSLQALATAVPPPVTPPFADGTTRLIDLDDGTGNPQFAVGESVELADAERGSRTIPTATLAVTTATTVADLMTFLAEAIGIEPGGGAMPGGISIDSATGIITIEGNYGEANDLLIGSGDLSRLDSTGLAIDQPFTLTKNASADGESVRTTFVIFDSLGSSLNINLAMVLDSRDDTGTTWRYFADSADSVGIDVRLATGTLRFDTNGRIVQPSNFAIQVDRSNSGADNPLAVTLQFGAADNGVTSLSDSSSQLAAVSQDGSALGTLVDFGIGQDGSISGTFSNGILRSLGRVALATFANNDGLVDAGSGMFSTGPNSGAPVISNALSFGAGRIIGGTLEMSNVDLSQEFINLILAQTGYTASSRVITTANQLIQQLLLIGR